MLKHLPTSNLTKDKRKRVSINIVEVCNLVLTVRELKKDPSFKPSILSQIDSLEELGSDAQGMYRMMRSLERRGLVARLLHRRPAVWYDISWQEGTPKLEQREHGWYDYNYVMDRDGQILFQTENNRWRIRGIKMTRAQIKREIKQQMLDIERRQQAKN